MMSEWSSEPAAEIATELIDLEFPAEFDESGARSTKLGVRAAADAHSTHGSHEF